MLTCETDLPATCLPPEDEIHLWQIPLDSAKDADLPFERILSPVELAQAARYHFPYLAMRFQVHRCALRLVLSRYIGIQPSEVIFKSGAQGKPFIPDADLQFSVSHSGGYALYAIGIRHRLGVDIEQIRCTDDLPQVAGRFFAQAEQKALFALSAEGQNQAFFHIWTQKEAFVKALGLGLSYSLDQFVVDANFPGGLLAWEGGNRADWSVLTFEPITGYRGALFYDGGDAKIRAFGMTVKQLL